MAKDKFMTGTKGGVGYGLKMFGYNFCFLGVHLQHG
jgi:hypothetical protein